MQFTTFILPEGRNKVHYELLLVFISLIASIIYNLFINCIIVKIKQIKYIDKLKISISFGDIFKVKSKKKQLIIIPVDSDYNDCKDKMIADNTTQYYVMKNIIPKINPEIIESKSGYKVFESNKKKFILFDIGKLNDNGLLFYENVGEYFNCIYKLCEIIEIEEKNHLVICPAIGGRLEFKNGNINSQQRLRVMLSSFESFDFKKYVEINVVLKKHKEKNKKYNLNML